MVVPCCPLCENADLIVDHCQVAGCGWVECRGPKGGHATVRHFGGVWRAVHDNTARRIK